MKKLIPVLITLATLGSSFAFASTPASADTSGPKPEVIDISALPAAQRATIKSQVAAADGSTTQKSDPGQQGATTSAPQAAPAVPVVQSVPANHWQDVHLWIGLLILFGGVTLGLHFLRRANLRQMDCEEWEHVPLFWGLFTCKRLAKRTYIQKSELTESECTMQAMGYIIIAASVIIMLFSA